MSNKRAVDNWNGTQIAPGESRSLDLSVSESYSGTTVKIPLHVRRGQAVGPTVFVTAAIHGDEMNGTGAIRNLVQDDRLTLRAGSLILVPVLNILGFERHSRYLPDRRDLNRCFPGLTAGSLTSRMARVIFDEIVARCDYGIDLHTAAIRRTNFPNVRADLSNPQVKRLAEAFGCQVIIVGKGPKGSLRRAACAVGCPTIVFEGGEVCKVEPGIIEWAIRGIRNVLVELDMLAQQPQRPPCQIVIKKTKWIRADRGGFLQFHVGPGDLVRKDMPMATNASLLGHEQNVLKAPFDAIVIGLTTSPAVSPGEPVCQLGQLPDGVKGVDGLQEQLFGDRLHGRMVDDLASNITLTDPPDGA
jgi:uncharacterized protein